ncbi:hypothetical protein Tco_0821476 [Tanacetum coccineum]|uniref:Xylulose kinase-1 n=1 Tax=Tanacetum coccineum TaxID=301880 RepID=A0ABQ5AFC4_9ASTR
MSTPKFAETHNLVMFLEKPEKSNGFEEIINFLNTSYVQYALTVNPTISTTCIEQLWASAKAKVVNGERQIQALVDKKKVIITETSIRSDLKLDDAEGTYCLPTATIFAELERIGAKTTARNEFSSTMASAIICLGTNQKFNFSKYIFDNMMKNLEGGVKFLMYLRVESSNDVSLGDQEDASKQGRKIADRDADAEEKEVVEKEVSTADPVTTVGEVVTTANVKSTTANAPTTTIEELTLAKTLIEIKAAKPKTITSAATTTTTTRPKARWVVVQEPSEFKTTSSPLQASQLP